MIRPAVGLGPFGGVDTEKVLGCLANLPVPIGERSLQGRIDCGALERCQRQNGTTTDRGLVAAGVEDRVEAGVECPERSHGRLPAEGVGVVSDLILECGERGRVELDTALGAQFAEAVGRDLGDHVVVPEGVPQRRLELGAAANPSCQLGRPAPNRRFGIAQGGDEMSNELVVGRSASSHFLARPLSVADSTQGVQCQCSNAGVGGSKPGFGGCPIPVVSGQCNLGRSRVIGRRTGGRVVKVVDLWNARDFVGVGALTCPSG